MTAQPQTQTARRWVCTVFSGNPGSARPLARGNTAMVEQVCRHELADTAPLQARASRAALATSCFFATSGQSFHFNVRCFNRTQAIQCCGHGLYAVAGLLGNAGTALSGNAALHTGTAEVATRSEGGNAAIALPVLGCRESVVPGWASAATGISPVAAAHAGGEDGYALWVYSSVDQVVSLQLDGEALMANTRRAIIATSWDTTTSSGFVLRYFAPQYGVPEDPVTGSAMRIAAEYWRQHSGNTTFQAWQCSAIGGVAWLDLDQQYCWLQGAHESTPFPVAA